MSRTPFETRTARAMTALAILLLRAAHADEPPAPVQPPWFVEEASARGLVFEHVSGHSGRYLFPEIHAGGAALFDADGDGDLDAYLVQSGGLEVAPSERPGNRLFVNQGDGAFRDATRGSGADDRGYGMGVATGDFDGDGRVDLYVTNVGANALLRNVGSGRFENVTGKAGVAGDRWSASATFFDYDLDGDFDLFVTNYSNWTIEDERDCTTPLGQPEYCGPATYGSPAPDVLYRNNGDGTFADVTRTSGLAAAFGTGLGVATGDFDGNGWPDLFVANDNMLDQLWLNQGDGTFQDEAVFRGCAADLSGKPKAGMGVGMADLDDDGDLDLLVCNLAGETDSLFINEDGYFADRTRASGLAGPSRPLTRFGVGLYDFDNDGILDLYQANGAIAREGKIYLDGDPYAEPNLLMRGLPGLRFQEVLPRGGTSEPLIATSRAAAFGDVDGDGGVDILVANRDAPPHLLINRVPGRGRWLRIRPREPSGGIALGASVSLELDDRRLRREVTAAASYQAASDPAAHFGLGAVERVETVEIRWPDGVTECFGPPALDRTVSWARGSGRPCSDGQLGRSAATRP